MLKSWARKHGKAMQWLARLGYWGRGLVYVAVGALACAAALSDRQAPSIGGTLTTLAGYPLGRLLVAATAGGLFGYAAWRFLQSVLDLHQDGDGTMGLLKRGATLVGSAIHALIGLIAAAVALNWEVIAGGGAGGGGIARLWAAIVLDLPLGQWVVAGTGAGAAMMGLAQAIKARGAAFRDIAASARVMRILRPLGRVGLLAKAVVFAMIGTFFLLAAWRIRASDAGGLREALQTVTELPMGNWALLFLAAALEAYGAFSLAKGWYHRLPGANVEGGAPPAEA